MSPTAAEADAMRHAIAISAFGLGSTSPNPPVGCVILDSGGRPVGAGYHRRKGEPHAEANALAAAGARAVGGTAVVTLEPCNHHGRTPPCHQALIDAGIVRVLIAVIDPTSRGDGGAALLRAAGVDVEVGSLADEALVVLGRWLTALELSRPWVIWAYEAGPDGPQAMGDEVLAEAGLRFGVDATLGADGHIEESAPGVHGQSAFALPDLVPDEPNGILSSLHAGGVRVLLLHGGASLGMPFANEDLVDEVAIYLPSPGIQSLREKGGSLLPTPHHVQAARRMTRGVLIRAEPRRRVEEPAMASRAPTLYFTGEEIR